MRETIFEKYAYVFLIVIAVAVLLQFVSQKDIIDETSAVVLNLHKLNSSYNLENAGETYVNATIYERNMITGSVILEPKKTKEIEGDDLKVLGEQYE